MVAEPGLDWVKRRRFPRIRCLKRRTAFPFRDLMLMLVFVRERSRRRLVGLARPRRGADFPPSRIVSPPVSDRGH